MTTTLSTSGNRGDDVGVETVSARRTPSSLWWLGRYGRREKCEVRPQSEHSTTTSARHNQIQGGAMG
jgi:hypothetical protein